MYLAFYNLKKQPFHITPDPEFLYLSPSHKEALAAIVYGIEERKGFVAVTGAIGAGKTTVLRSYLEDSQKKRLKVIYVFNSNLTFEGLLRTIYQELGIMIESNRPAEMVNRLYETLIEEYKLGNIVVLVVDEAQNMPIDTLENLRMISNLETSKDKLIQIVLVGQPQFREVLNSKKLKQLKQRLAVQATIQPLTAGESVDYVKLRLWRAGCSDVARVFTEPALKKIIRRARGIPRVLNILCDNALITGFGYQERPVTKRVVQEIIRDFTRTEPSWTVHKWLPKSAVLALTLVLLLIAWALLPRWPMPVEVMETSVSHDQGEHGGAVGATGPIGSTSSESRHTEAVPAKQEQSVSRPKDESTVVVRTVAPGDTLLGLARDVYGLSAKAREMSRLVDLLRQINPQLKNADLILPGQQITFPDARKARPGIDPDGGRREKEMGEHALQKDGRG